MSAQSDASLLVAHPDALLREELADVFAGAVTTDVRRAADPKSALHQLRLRPADVTLLGSRLADRVTDLVAQLLDAGTEAVVVLADSPNDTELLAALQAGALGYIGRETPLDRLVYDIRGALRGEACLPRDKLAPVLRLLIDRRREEDALTARLARLSKREREVLGHLADGVTNDEIARRLFLSTATVRTHVQNILTKLEVHSRLEAIAVLHGTMPQEATG